jgi:hypothetical protein
MKLLSQMLLLLTLGISVAHAGPINVTVTADQFAFQVWALQPGAHPSFTLTPGKTDLEAALQTAAGNPSVDDRQQSPGTRDAMAASVTHGDSLVNAILNPALGSASVHASVADDDGAWRQGYSRIWSFPRIVLAPRSGLTITGRARLTFENHGGSLARADGIFSTCLHATIPTACDVDYSHWTTMAMSPDGFNDSFSMSIQNPGDTPLPMTWDLILFTQAVAPPVPEPATWTMLCAGLLLAGVWRKPRWRGSRAHTEKGIKLA